MSAETVLVWLLIGAIAGWLAGMIVRGHGLGLVGNIIVGIVGAVIGGWLFERLGVSTSGGVVGAFIGATVGAVVLLFLIGLVRRRRV